MKKEKLSKKIARMNSKSSKPKKERTPEQQKRAKIIKWTVGGVVFASLLGLAIGLPLGISTNQTTTVSTRDPKQTVVTISTPNKGIDLSVEDILNGVKTEQVLSQEQFNEAKKTLTKYLYEQEYDAEQLFKKAWDKSKVEGTTSDNSRFYTKLKSYDDIKAEKEKFLKDERRRYQRSYGYDNWESEFNKYLTNDAQFGGATTIESAVDYLVSKEIEQKSLARFSPEFSTEFLYKDVKNRVLSEDVKDKNGNVVFKKGDRLFKGIIVLEDDADKGDLKANASIPNIDKKDDAQKTPEEKEKSKLEAKVSAFLTKSFVKEYMNANNVVNKFYFADNAQLKDRFKFFNVSQITLNIKPATDNSQTAWTISKDVLKEILKYSITEINQADQTNPQPTTKEVKTTLSVLENFKGAFSDDKAQNDMDKQLLNFINSSTNKSNSRYLGQQPIRNLNQLFSESTEYGLSFIDNLFTKHEATNILSQTLFNKLKEVLFVDENANLLPEASTLANKPLTEINELNRKITEFIDKMSDGDLKKAGGVFKEVFGEKNTNAQDTNSYRIYSVYKLRDDANIVFSSKGMQIIVSQKIDSADSLNDIIKKQLQLNANNQYDQQINSTIRVNDLFKELSNDNFVLNGLFENNDFTNKLLEEQKANKSQEEKDKYIQELKTLVSNNISSFYINQILDLNSKIQTTTDTIKKNNTNADFNFDAQKIQWQIKGKETQSDQEAVYEALKTHFGITNK
ncbi:HinT-interacting membrane complex protein P80 [Mycoplasma procyoni]|uniref:HinT-interacting membrane complex protein P80 n=1 Tax=Mycoplasma procyoni TaxID=568784 RepID=UPI00197B1D48|nr:hypothetical protein [Mycoplasma procyoni]MBN3534516.1 hypothetical protein [Mycoplasma procyoni]